MKTSSAKAKGRKLQHFVCERIASIFQISFDNQDDQCLIHSREMGQSGSDIITRGEIFKKFHYDIECKNTENLSLYSAIEQAKQNTGANRNWLVVHKKNKNKPIVIMDWECFEDLIRKNIY